MKKNPKKIIIILIILLILSIGGSFAYLALVKYSCKEVTQVILEYGRTLDAEVTSEEMFQGIVQKKVKSYLTDEVKEKLNARKFIKAEVMKKIEDAGLSNVITEDVTDHFMDIIIDDAIKDADYEIIDAKAGFTSCTVTVRTSNVDYMQLSSEISDSLAEDVENPDSSLWSHAGNIADTILGMILGNSDEDENLGDTIAEAVVDYCYEKKADCAKREATGQITYAFSHGKWTIESVDSDLVGAYYGVSLEELGINLNNLGWQDITFK